MSDSLSPVLLIATAAQPRAAHVVPVQPGVPGDCGERVEASSSLLPDALAIGEDLAELHATVAARLREGDQSVLEQFHERRAGDSEQSCCLLRGQGRVLRDDGHRPHPSSLPLSARQAGPLTCDCDGEREAAEGDKRPGRDLARDAGRAFAGVDAGRS